MLKETFNNPDVILVLNFDKIYNPSLYVLDNLKKLPVYTIVDMSKILIQYEYMVYKKYNYVIDLDIKCLVMF